MTFVNEKISDEDKKKYGFGIDKSSWIIDREKNSFLIHTGGMGMGEVSCFDFYCNDEVIKIIAKESGKLIKDQKKYHVLIEIKELNFPSNFSFNKEKTVEMIKSAFEKYGRFGSKDLTASTTVKI